ncbi:hypothetical protein RRG08_064856 [Elysia crispata]|uniref:Uncharacterized protein n=1 Tax=Elysia crispata TaxID=231223 RepID=A0AAE0YK27_9GAST|nr:hypothetical protein RRG08_064856 [Elysia crispata]
MLTEDYHRLELPPTAAGSLCGAASGLAGRDRAKLENSRRSAAPAADGNGNTLLYWLTSRVTCGHLEGDEREKREQSKDSIVSSSRGSTMIYSCIQRDLDSCSSKDDPCIQQEVLDGSLP